MKNIYSILMAAVMAVVFSFSAHADVTITLKVNDAVNMTGYLQYYDASYMRQQINLDLTQFTGENGGTAVIPASYGYVYLNTEDGYLFTYAKNETDGSSASLSNGSKSAYFYLYADANLVVECKSEAEAYSESCTVICDDYTKVALSTNMNRNITLDNNETVVKFMPNGESPFYARHSEYGKSLYKITVNDEEIAASGSQYSIPVANGDVVRIYANYPDVSVPVKFVFNEGAENCLSSVRVDGEEVTNYKDEDFTVKLGSKLEINGNTNDYQFNSVKVNGSTVYFYSSYQYTVNTDTEQTIEIDATKYGTIKAYVTVDDPANITVYKGYSSSGAPIELEAGVKTEVELNSNNPIVSWQVASGCYVTSVSYIVNGEVSDKTSTTSVYGVAEGAEFEFVTGKIVRDQVATIWVDDAAQSSYGNNLRRSYDSASQSLVSGENVIEFFANDNPYMMSWYNPSMSNVYHNQVRITPMYEGSHNYQFSLADGDYMKVYLASAPEECVATFELHGLTADDVVVNIDGREYATWSAGVTVLKDTEFAVSGEAVYEVKVGGETITPEYGVYSFQVTDADTTIEIYDIVSGVDGVTVDAGEVVYYNLQGVRVQNPENGIFIRKQGNKVTKVVL